MSDIVERIKAAIPYTDTEAEDDILRLALKEIQMLREVIDLVYIDMKNKGYCDQETFRLVIECRKEQE